jgi:hypothetical protein
MTTEPLLGCAFWGGTRPEDPSPLDVEREVPDRECKETGYKGGARPPDFEDPDPSGT